MKRFYCTAAIVSLFLSCIAQPLSKKDYNRAVSYLWSNLNNQYIYNANIIPIWFGDNSGFAFVAYQNDKKIFNKLSWADTKNQPLFDHQRLAQILSELTSTEVDSQNLGLTNLRIPRPNTMFFTFGNDDYKLSLDDYTIEKQIRSLRNSLESTSPDQKWTAYVQDYNLFLRSNETNESKQLSTNGKKFYEFGSNYGWSDIIEGENGDRPSRVSIRWSPDSKWIQSYITDLRNAEKMYLLDWSIDTLYKPKLLSYYRASPGDTNIVRMIPIFYNVYSGEEIVKDELRSTHTNPISYRWSKQSDIVYQENTFRGYQKIHLHRLDLQSKSEELLYEEISNTNIDNYQSRIYEEIGIALIISERDGWKQIYQLNLMDKSLSRVTNGDYYVNDILHFDTTSKTIYFTASGKEPNRNPYFQHLYKLVIGEEPQLLTTENANHDIYLSPDANWFVDNISNLAMPTISLLKSTSDRTLSIELSKALVKSPKGSNQFVFPEPFEAIARDNKTIIYGAIWKPSNFNKNEKYPIIDQSYTGPHTYMYPRSFSSAFSRSNQALAELGFIVVTIDGMGTANRSKAFHNVSYKNMGKNLEDHKLAILQLARKNKWIDTTRVGIFGHSAGGYDAAHALLEYPDFYKVAVASSADHDFRMEKAWWPEMYMGWPVDSTYHLVSNITMAKNLKGKLLITHGGIDENVNPSATFKLAEALIKENKEFDMLIFPSQKHGYIGAYNDYFTKKRWNYFVEHLLNNKPIWDFNLK